MKKILVTGGAGFIGSHFVDAFMEAGHRTLVVDDLSSGSEANLNSGAEFEQIDLGDPTLPRILATFRPEVIYHFAAQIDVRKSFQAPSLDASENILNSLKLLEAGLDHGVGYFVFASSGGAIYGEPQQAPQGEDHPERPVSPYGVAKLAVDHYLASIGAFRGLPTCSMRFSNVYGPRQNTKGDGGVVAHFVDHALKGKPLAINGDGAHTRDFIFVKDLAKAGMRILERRPTGVINLGTGRETTILDLAKLIRGIIAPDLLITHGQAIAGEQKRSVLGTTRAALELDWNPETPLSTGICHMIDEFRGLGRRTTI